MDHLLIFIFGLAVLLATQSVFCLGVVEFNSVEPRRIYTEASFSVVSGRNASGHWNSKLHFSHAANKGIFDEEGNETNVWKMNFDQKIEATEEGEKVHLYATVTIPPSGSPEFPSVVDETPGAVSEDQGEFLLASGYQYVAKLGYYKFHPEARTWYNALRTCYEESAQLAVINSEEEASMLRMLFQEHPTIPGGFYNDAAFLGANDLENEGIYVTIDDVPLQDAGYLHWQSDQPNNYGHGDTPGQDCIAMNREAEYFDAECYIKLPFICEKSLGH